MGVVVVEQSWLLKDLVDTACSGGSTRLAVWQRLDPVGGVGTFRVPHLELLPHKR